MTTIDQASGAYIHVRPDNSVFYVGKGTRKRSRSMKRNPFHDNIVSKYGKENIKIGFIECSSEYIAFELEKGMIKCFRRMNINLANMTDGGEGCANPTEETRKKISFFQKGKKCKPRTPEHSANASASQIGRIHKEETKLKISMANKGKKRTKEQIEKMSITAFNSSQETRAKIRSALTGKKHSEETRKKMSQSALLLMTSEYREKLSKANKNSWTIERRIAASERNKKRIISDETKAKIAKSVKEYYKLNKKYHNNG